MDFSLFLDAADDQQRKTSQDMLLDAFSQAGFVKIVNHGIPESLIHEMFDWVCLRVNAIGSWAKIQILGSKTLRTPSRNKRDGN